MVQLWHLPAEVTCSQTWKQPVMKKWPCIATQKYYCTLNRLPRQCEMSLPGDPASLHKAGRVSPSLADGRIAARAAASSFCIRVMRTVSLPADRQTDTKHAGIERVWGRHVLQMAGFIWQRLQEDHLRWIWLSLIWGTFKGLFCSCFKHKMYWGLWVCRLAHWHMFFLISDKNELTYLVSNFFFFIVKQEKLSATEIRKKSSSSSFKHVSRVWFFH